MVGAFAKDKLCFILPIPRFNQDNPYRVISWGADFSNHATPLWAQADWIDWQGILDTAQFIIQNSEKYSQMQVSNRFKGIPPVQEYFIDGVHPNELGMELYTQNLVKEIDRIGF